MISDWEAIATRLLWEFWPPETPVDQFELARKCGFSVFGGNRDPYTRIGGTCAIHINETQSMQLQDEEVAYALGQWALWRAGRDVTEEGARHIGRMLLIGHVSKEAPEPADSEQTMVVQLHPGRSRQSQ